MKDLREFISLKRIKENIFNGSRNENTIVGEEEYIIDFKEGDINGDGVKDKVLLLGQDYSKGTGIYKTNIKLVILEEKNNNKITIDFPNNEGYNSCLFLGDFRGNNRDDILIRITSGASGNYLFAYIVGYLDNKYKIIFNSEDYFKAEDYYGEFKENYKVEIISKILKEKYLLDISNRQKEYLDLIYSGNKVIDRFNISISSLNSLVPINQCNEDKIDLLAFQQVLGINNGDLLGMMESYIKWEKKYFKTYFQFLGIKGV